MGKLILIATPIGNLGDISPRAVAALQEATIVAAEDTRHSGLLLNHLGIKKPLISYYHHNRKEREGVLLAHLAAGEIVALVTDAGTPAISDPGWEMVAAAQAQGYEVDAIPGPCALINALVLSGLPTERFLFEGFLPRGKECGEALATLKTMDCTLVFYEAPHRLRETLAVMAEVLGGERQAALCREMTKKFQEVRRGTLAEHQAYFATQEPRGEFCIVVAPAPVAPPMAVSDAKLQEAAARLLAGGMKHKAAAKELSLHYGIGQNEAYRLILAANTAKK